MYKFLLFAGALFNSYAYSYERYGWPGEGVPVFSFIKESYVFCETPKQDSSCIKKPVNYKKQISLTNSDIVNESRFITISPVTMETTDDFVITDYNLPVSKGDKLVNHQYAAEGYYEVEIKGKIYQVFVEGYHNFLTNTDKEPETEWWVKIINKGWLKLTNNNVNYHPREF